jgi:hypothetical protein
MFQIQLSTLVREVTTEVLRADLFGVRRKDYTSVWCENKSTSGGSLSAWVQRTNNKNTSSVKTVDRYYGSWSYNGATKNMKNLPKGTYYYLPNYVKEDGYKYATLGYIMNKEAVSYHIAWSPDSI